MIVNPEVIRDCVRIIKKRFEEYQIPALKLPADSVIETTVRECINTISGVEDSWKETLTLIPKECRVHHREGGGLEDFEASVAISISNLASKYEAQKEALDYIMGKFDLAGYHKTDLFALFSGKANIPGLKMALELVEQHSKAMKGMEPMIKIDPAANAAFERCSGSILAAIDRGGQPSVSELMG